MVGRSNDSRRRTKTGKQSSNANSGATKASSRVANVTGVACAVIPGPPSAERASRTAVAQCESKRWAATAASGVAEFPTVTAGSMYVQTAEICGRAKTK